MSDADPVEEVVFSLCDGQLYRMAIDYDRDKTSGLTSEDIIEGVSIGYSAATHPAVKTSLPSVSFSEV